MRLSIIAAAVLATIAFTAPARAAGWINWSDMMWCQYYDNGETDQLLNGQGKGPKGYKRRDVVLVCEYLLGFGVY